MRDKNIKKGKVYKNNLSNKKSEKRGKIIMHKKSSKKLSIKDLSKMIKEAQKDKEFVKEVKKFIKITT